MIHDLISKYISDSFRVKARMQLRLRLLLGEYLTAIDVLLNGGPFPQSFANNVRNRIKEELEK